MGSSNGLYMYVESTVPMASLNVKDWLTYISSYQ